MDGRLSIPYIIKIHNPNIKNRRIIKATNNIE